MSGRPTYQVAPVVNPSTSERSQFSMWSIHVATPSGPRRWPHRRRKLPSASIAARASPARADPITTRPVSTASRRTSPNRSSDGADAAASVAIHCTFESPARRMAIASSASSCRMARASAAMASPWRCTLRRTTIPLPNAAAFVPSPAGTGSPVTSASSWPAGDSMAGPSAAGPTMSPRTAPASTEASCSGSPTRSSRASLRTASNSRAINDSETMEVSSTTTTSWGRRFRRS